MPIMTYRNNGEDVNTTTVLSTLSTAEASIKTAAGTTLIVQKTVAANAFATAGADLTGVANGALYIENIVVACDSGTVTTATNLEITTNNVYGPALLYSEAIANLTASQASDLFTASVAKQRTVIENGKKLAIASTGANAAGTGHLTITVVLRRLVDGASIAAA